MRHGDRLVELSAYLDGELLPEEMAEIRDHLASCAECGAEYEALRMVSQRVHAELARPVMPATLRARVQEATRRAAAAADDRPHTPGARRLSWTMRLAAGLIIAAVSAGASALLVRRPAATPVANDVIASHIRSLMPGHLTDVTSNDTHNVKPWFNGRLDLSPSVPRLDSLGFPLVGGRLDYVGGRPVAVVVYARRQHVINVFSWPVETGEARAAAATDDKGYHLVQWMSHGTEYWAASDVNAADLAQFIELFTHADGAARER